MFQFVLLICTSVVSVICSDNEAWYYYQKTFDNANREALIIRSVKTEDSFHVNESISKWTSLTLGNISYSIGLTEKGIVILFSTLKPDRTAFNILSRTLDLQRKPLDIALFDSSSYEKDGIIAVISYEDHNELDWFILKTDLQEKWYTWSNEYSIYHINIFKQAQNHFLLLIDKRKDGASLKMYKIVSEGQDKQNFIDFIDLPEKATSSAMFSFQEDIFLTIPQSYLGELWIYKFTNDKFEKFTTLKSPNLTSVTCFEINSRPYLTIDGQNQGIYAFTNDKLIKQDVVQGNLEGIENYLPIPIRTYRDEVILFADRALEHESHTAYTVEVIINNGDKFEEHEDIPCSHHGENVEWLTCFAHDSGIKGSSYIAIEDKLALIVPQRNQNYSEIFIIEYSIIQMSHPKEHELERLLDMKKTLEVMIEEQKIKPYQQNEPDIKLLRDNEKPPEPILKKMSHAELFDLRSQLEEIGSKMKDIKQKVEHIKNETNVYHEIIINNTAEFTGTLTAKEINVESFLKESAVELLENIVNRKNISKITGPKMISHLEAINLSFEELNGLRRDDIILSKEHTLIINGPVVFEQSLKSEAVNVVNNRINDLFSLQDLISLENHFHGELRFTNISVQNEFHTERMNKKLSTQGLHENSSDILELQSAFLPGNVLVTMINGENLEELINDLCLVNVKCYVPRNLTVKGKILINDTHTNFLNDLKFPAEYILMDEDSHAEITGKKSFENMLSAEEIMTQHSVGGVNTSELITLATDQDLTGQIIFDNLELTEVLNVTGNITGKRIKDFLPNPTLNETDEVHSNVVIKELIVDGEVIIDAMFNAVKFSEILNDLIYKNEDGVEVTGRKEFPEGIKIEDLSIKSDMINNIKIENLITKHEDENLFGVSILKGDVKIKRLFVHGKYNGYNISELDDSLVKLTGDQFVGSTLLFQDELIVQNLEITDKLNDHKADEYLYKNSDGQINWEIDVGNITADNVIIEGNFHGEIIENNWTTTLDNVLYYNKKQIIEVPYEIMSVEVGKIESTRVNGIAFGNSFMQEDNEQDIIERLKTGILHVENLNITGSLELREVNGKSLNELLLANPFESGQNIDNLVVDADVHFHEVDFEKLSDVSWENLLKLLVFKNETSITLKDTKTFTDDFLVDKLIETRKINDVLLSNILRTTGEQDVLGSIVIKGEVAFEKLIANKLNEIWIHNITDNMMIDNDTYTITGDIVFNRLPYIDQLILHGNVNSKNPKVIFDKLYYKNEAIDSTKQFTFLNEVTVFGNMSCENVGDTNFLDTFSNIVYVDQPNIINSEIIFIEPVVVEQDFQINVNLNTTLLSGYDTQNWIDKAIFVNQGLIKGHFFFEDVKVNKELFVKVLNEQNMNSIVRLKSKEDLEYLNFEKLGVLNDIQVGNLVNGYKLLEEYEKTMMAHGNQEISANLIFRKNTLVRENLSVQYINKKKASKLIKINKDQNLTSPFIFNNNCLISSKLKIRGLLNGVNSEALNKNIQRFSSVSQEITNDWNVLQNITFNNDVTSNGTIGNVNITQLAHEVQDRINYKQHTEAKIIADYEAFCTDIKYQHKIAQTQLYKFSYFENPTEIPFPTPLNNFFYLELFSKKYLLANGNDCMSHLFVFYSKMFYPKKFNIITGTIEQLVVVRSENTAYLVTRGSGNGCYVNGTNIWEFADDNLELKFVMENQDLIQDSLVRDTFYGLDSEGVTEYQIRDIGYRKYRTWRIDEENIAFFPRGISGTGLAMRTGQNVILLDRSNSFLTDDNDINADVIIRGTMSLTPNTAIPGRNGGDLVVLNVNSENTKKSFLAVVHHTRSTVGGQTDAIKIYDDPIKGGLFHEIHCYKPSSLVSIEFGQGETLLAFLEDNKIIKFYEYRGIEGFKYRTSAKVSGTKLINMQLPVDNYNSKNALGILEGDMIKIMHSVMIGNRLEPNFDCDL